MYLYIFMDELVQIQFEELSSVKLKDSGIRVIKDRTILAPGFWNGRNYSREEIVKCFNNTDWSDPDVMSLIADHKDDDAKGRPLTLRDWLGFTSNQYLTEDGRIKADLNICNQTLALQLIDGRAPFGISPFVYGKYDPVSKSQMDFIIKNNAIVVEPACKESYINAYLNDDKLNEKLVDVSAFERIRKSMGKSVGEFYATPRDPPSSSKLPIYDKSHVQNAMARFNQTQFSSSDERSKAKSKIISAAKKFGIEIKEFGKLEETEVNDAKGKEVESYGLQPIKTKKKKIFKTELEGGQNKMEIKEKLEDENQDSKEEKVEEVSEPVVEEVVEEVALVEEPKVEESVEEESEEKLMEQLVKITEKLMNKRKLTPEQAKMQKLESEISSLRNEIKKLSEVKVEVKTDNSAEKLSAKPKTIAKTIQTEEGFKMFGKGPSQGSKELAAIMNL